MAAIIGDSFATLATPLEPNTAGSARVSPSPAASQSLFTTSGVIGLTFETSDRDYRVEFGGRGRSGLVSNGMTTLESAEVRETDLFITTAKYGRSTPQ